MKEAPLDDDAILTLLKYAGWEVRYEDLDQEWLVRPPDNNFYGFAAFVTLKSALNYMLMYKAYYE